MKHENDATQTAVELDDQDLASVTGGEVGAVRDAYHAYAGGTDSSYNTACYLAEVYSYDQS